MARVTIHPDKPADKPREKAGNGLVHVTDADGRKIGLREPEFLEEYRILQAVGPDRAANHVYMQMVNPLLYVAEIDGDPVEIPRTHPQIEALIKRVGRKGFIAVNLGIREHFATADAELEKQIKNLLGTQDS